MWEELQRAIRNSKHSPLRTSTDSDLDAFEERLNFKLPQSYREFVKLFGRCELSDDNAFNTFSFAAPGHKGSHEDRFDLEDCNEFMRRNTGGEHYTENPEVGERLIWFGFDLNDYFGWAPTEVTNYETNEYAIYAREPGAYRRVASSFYDFVMDIALREELEVWRRWVSEGGEALASNIGSRTDDKRQDPRIFLEPM